MADDVSFPTISILQGSLHAVSFHLYAYAGSSRIRIHGFHKQQTDEEICYNALRQYSSGGIMKSLTVFSGSMPLSIFENALLFAASEARKACTSEVTDRQQMSRPGASRSTCLLGPF